jgi:hypothetical protein
MNKLLALGEEERNDLGLEGEAATLPPAMGSARKISGWNSQNLMSTEKARSTKAARGCAKVPSRHAQPTQ